MSRLKWIFLVLLRYYRNLGLRVTFYVLLSVLTALLSPLVQRALGGWSDAALQFDAVMPILSILATSMLAVSTFSLNIMVSAYRAAAASTTPRVHRLLLEDTTSQSVLATFIGAFVYSLTSIILYQAGFYTEKTAALVMAVTIFVVILVVVSLLRWIQYLTTLGSVDDSLRAVAIRAGDALSDLAEAPTFGASPLTKDIVLPTQCATITAPASGYIQLVDVARLQECLPAQGSIYLRHRPGAYVLKGQKLALVSGIPDDETRDRLTRAFTIGNQRTFEQDATYGLVVMSEIACKALSPGINDSGTAIAALHSLKKLLWEYGLDTSRQTATTFPRVFLPCLDHAAMLQAAFNPIARDGAGNIEVSTHLREALAELAASPRTALAEASRVAAQKTLTHADNGTLLPEERAALNAIAV